MSNGTIEYKDLIAFHPGQYVEEIIEDYNITQKEFAERLGISAKTVSKIVNGEDSISKDTANKLSKLTGISMGTWLNLQSAYDVKIAEMGEQQNYEEIEVCQLIDFSYFKQHGFVENKRYSIQEKVSELRKLFQIADLTYLKQFNHLVSYRNTQKFTERSIVNSNVMLELAIQQSKDKSVTKFDKKRLEQILPELRKLINSDSDSFYPLLKEKLLECGIVLVGLPSLKNANLNGATKKYSDGSVLLLLTDRNKASDIFWFSLFHELGHIMHNDFYSDQDNQEAYLEKERLADVFAKDYLIPSEEYIRFVKADDFSRQAIVEFSEMIDIHPSIVLGRLQKEGRVDFNQYRDLKVNYQYVLN